MIKIETSVRAESWKIEKDYLLTSYLFFSLQIVFVDGDEVGRFQVPGIGIRRRGCQDGGIQADPEVQRDPGKLNTSNS